MTTDSTPEARIVPGEASAETERYALGLLIEEMGEAAQILGKWLRFGEGRGPKGAPYHGANARELAPVELGDVRAAIRFAVLAGLVSEESIARREEAKLAKLLDPASLDAEGKRLAPPVATPSTPAADLEAESRERAVKLTADYLGWHPDALQPCHNRSIQAAEVVNIVASALSARQIAQGVGFGWSDDRHIDAAVEMCRDPRQDASPPPSEEAAAMVERLREALEGFCLSAECAAGCDEGVSQDDAYSEILSFAGSALATAYADARTALQGESRD